MKIGTLVPTPLYMRWRMSQGNKDTSVDEMEHD